MAHLSKVGKRDQQLQRSPEFRCRTRLTRGGIEQLISTSWGETWFYLQVKMVCSQKSLPLSVLTFECTYRDPAQGKALQLPSVRSKGIARRVEDLFNAASRAFAHPVMD